MRKVIFLNDIKVKSFLDKVLLVEVLHETRLTRFAGQIFGFLGGCREHGRLPFKRKTEIALGLARTLESVHGTGIVHGDLHSCAMC